MDDETLTLMADTDLLPEAGDTNGDTPAEAPAPPPAPAPEPIEYADTADEGELRNAIFQSSDTLEIVLDVPEWKIKGKDGRMKVVQVLVRALSAYERAQYVDMMQKTKGDLTKAYPDIVILSARHPVTKKHIFKPADRGGLQQRIGNAVERIALNALDLSGLTEQALNNMLKK
jgi:hypothetical protein